MDMKETTKENILCIIGGILMAITFIAVAFGQGNKGLLDLI